MKNQEIKEKSGLVLEKLSENELEAIVGGGSFLEFFSYGFLALPDEVKVVFTGKNFYELEKDRLSSLFSIMGFATFVAVIEAVCYGVYKCGGAAVRKLKRQPVNKVDSDRGNVVS